MDEVTVDAHTPLLKAPASSHTMNDPVWTTPDEFDAAFGGPAARRELERKLLWKVDKRMSILVLIYILNYVRFSLVDYLRAL